MAKELPDHKSAREASPSYRIRMILCIVPVVISLILGGVFVVRQHRASSPVERAIRASGGMGGISIRQKTSGPSSGPLEEKQTVQVETIEDGLREMGFLITEEYYFTEMLTNKKAQNLFGGELGFRKL